MAHHAVQGIIESIALMPLPGLAKQALRGTCCPAVCKIVVCNALIDADPSGCQTWAVIIAQMQHRILVSTEQLFQQSSPKSASTKACASIGREGHAARSCVLDILGLARRSHAARMGHAGSCPPI